MTLKAAIAVNRFGYGARPGEVNEASKDPERWLINQLKPVQFSQSLPDSSEIATKIKALRKKIKKEKKSAESKSAERKYYRETIRSLTADGITQAILSDNSINWRLLDFFSNHFSVTAQGKIKALAPTLEREAIAPNLYGNFEDLLLAVIQHPVMLLYLNNESSFGPQSRFGQKKNKGMNENLAREILELHTLGVNGGYLQQDVTELARAITGWGINNPKRNDGIGFFYRQYGHQPGRRVLLGKKYPDTGVKQGEHMLKDLARHPSTANYVCNKLAHHFISDEPDPVLVKKLVNTWTKTNGNIREVMISMIRAEESWHETSEKFKTPREFVISAYRAVGRKKLKPQNLLGSMTRLGQQPFNAGSPAGFSDEQKDWDGSSALMKRIDWSMLVSGQMKGNVKKLMTRTLSDAVSENTFNRVSRAESRKQAYTLLLMSPEFQRR